MRWSAAVLLAASGLASAGRTPELPPQSQCGRLPEHERFVNLTYVLPDPFTFLDGRPVHTKGDWDCRAEQLRSLFQKYELGEKPPRPAVLTKTFSNDTLTITAGHGNNDTIEFSMPISYPENGTAPYPAMIVYDALSIPAPDGVALITLDIDAIAVQNDASSRGMGLFFDLYGTNASAGALMAWAWAVSRVIDVLEETPEAMLDLDRLAVTGCSRNGKGAMVAGAFDQRIALTIPQESGSGGDACWRVSRDMLVNHQLYTQTAWEIVTENVWFSTSFDPFAANNYTIGLLPVDHHELVGLIAPRGVYSTSNIEFLWLGDQSNYDCMKSGNKIFQALGVADHQGFSQDGPHDHCAFPDDQVGEIQAFYDKFLFGKSADTSVMETDGNWTYNARWAPWRVPRLW